MDRMAFKKKPDGSETASPSGSLGTRSRQRQEHAHHVQGNGVGWGVEMMKPGM